MDGKVTQRKIYYGQEKLIYYLERKKVKRVNLRLKGNGDIFVSASISISAESIDEWVLSKFDYLQKVQGNYLEANTSLLKPKLYRDGEQIPFLGQALVLKVEAGEKNFVSRQGDFLIITLKAETSVQGRERLVQSWLRQQADSIFKEIAQKTYHNMQEQKISYPVIKVRKMISRWGSCQPQKGVITLNQRLIGAPLSSIEYVIIHEFCHLVHPNHSKAFYALVEKYMMHWKTERKYLKEKSGYLIYK